MLAETHLYEDACYCLTVYLESFYADPSIRHDTYVLWLMGISLFLESLNIIFITQFKGLQ